MNLVEVLYIEVEREGGLSSRKLGRRAGGAIHCTGKEYDFVSVTGIWKGVGRS